MNGKTDARADKCAIISPKVRKVPQNTPNSHQIATEIGRKKIHHKLSLITMITQMNSADFRPQIIADESDGTDS
jgi:hypothetical protein